MRWGGKREKKAGRLNDAQGPLADMQDQDGIGMLEHNVAPSPGFGGRDIEGCRWKVRKA